MNDPIDLMSLRFRWKAHEHGQLAFANLVGGQGVLDRTMILNSDVPHVLADLIKDVWDPVPPLPRVPDASAAAQAMLANRDMNDARSVAAVRTYALERLTLLHAVLSISIIRAKPSKSLAREVTAWQTFRSRTKPVRGATALRAHS